MGRPDEKVTTVEQGVYPVPDISIKDLLGAIPYVAACHLAFPLLNGPLLELTVSNVPPCGHHYTCELQFLRARGYIWLTFLLLRLGFGMAL
jgi:hypothetical protein